MNQDNLWYRTAVFYEVSVRTFADSNADGIGDLTGLNGKLDYLKHLGVDAIWMMPIFPSPLRDDGYDVTDYYAVHRDCGSLDDVRTLITEAHRRGLRIVVELVLNHTSDEHPWFQASRDPLHPEHATYRDWYVWSDTDKKYEEARIIFLDIESSNWQYEAARDEFYWHRFFSHQPDLNYDNPSVQRAILKVVQFWLDLGVDGFRVDATPYLYERRGTSCENLPETHVYLKRLRSFVNSYSPDALLLSEANQWPEDSRAYLGDGDEFHMNFNFPLMTRIFLALARGDRAPILQILARTPPIPATCQWATFLRCHDELTLEMVTPEERDFLWEYYAPNPRMRLNLGIRRRLAPLLGNDRARIELANSLLFTLPGTPVIYYGDEIGMGDNIWLEDRDGVRTPMQWTSGPNAGFSDADPAILTSPLIDEEEYDYRTINVMAQHDDPNSLLNRMRDMIAVRKSVRPLSLGEMRLLEPEGAALFAYLRVHEDETVLVLHNLSPEPQAAELDLAAYAGKRPTDLFSGQAIAPITDAPYRLGLPRYGYRWLRLS